MATASSPLLLLLLLCAATLSVTALQCWNGYIEPPPELGKTPVNDGRLSKENCTERNNRCLAYTSQNFESGVKGRSYFCANQCELWRENEQLEEVHCCASNLCNSAPSFVPISIAVVLVSLTAVLTAQ